MYYEDGLGSLVIDELGARVPIRDPRRSRPPARRPAAYPRRVVYAPNEGVYTERVARAATRLVSAIPGVSNPEAAIIPLGFPLQTFSLALGTAASAQARPQVPFQGRRLVAGVARTGASATGIILVTSFFIGNRNQLASGQPMPLDAFLQNAFNTDLVLTPATVGQDVVINLSCTTPLAGADTIVVSLGLLGSALN